MEVTNSSAIHEFILLGFGIKPHQRSLLFIFFSILYVLTLAENVTIIILVFLDAQLSQIPMYILLSNFSWLEICYVTTTVPRMLLDLASPRGTISFHACFVQFYIFFSLGTTEFFFLSAMALDRCLAICRSMRYPQLMSPNACYLLVASCWVLGFLGHVLPVTLISQLSFCGSNVIDHFVCDAVPIMNLACPPLGNVPFIFHAGMHILFFGNVLFVVSSYGTVIFVLMKSFSRDSRKKAFSTISMHVLVVTLFCGSVGAMYLISQGENHSELNKTITVFYAAVTPFLNPLIYCLRNDQVKEALVRIWKRKLGGQRTRQKVRKPHKIPNKSTMLM